MKLLPLTKGIYSILDSEDHDVFGQFSWYASRTTHGFYAKRVFRGRSFYLHRLIIKAKKGEIVDHVNGDTLDNRKSNLRIVTPTQNNFNQKISCRNKHGFRGIYLHPSKKRHKRWQATGQANGTRWCRYFLTKNEAIKWQKEKHNEVFGKYRRDK
jgi:hypothetical protein